jgi:hypothetical protein
MATATFHIINGANVRGTGAKFRRQRPGPEQDMLEEFLAEALPFRVPRGCNLTLFREPRLDSGFPDAVLVVWHEATVRRWTCARADLKAQDLRLLQLLVECGPLDEAQLRATWRLRPAASLDRLAAADLVRKTRSRWAAKSVQRSFAVRNIIAIEAKVADWKSAAEQAYLNTWFTTESYVLLPAAKKGHPLLAAAKNLGIGVLSPTQGLLRRPRSKPVLPRSYASWLFNEWAWRAYLRDAT